jgi:hypothetical protein
MPARNGLKELAFSFNCRADTILSSEAVRLFGLDEIMDIKTEADLFRR